MSYLKWLGSKNMLGPFMQSICPPHETSVEIFAGSAVWTILYKNPAPVHDVINDLDDDLIRLFRVLRNNTSDLIRLLQLTPYARQEFLACNESMMSGYPGVDDDVEKVRIWYTVMQQRWGTDNSRKKGFSTTATMSNLRNQWRDNIDGELVTVAERLQNVIIEHLPWERCLAVYDTPKTLVYADPPYVRSTRVGGSSAEYNHEMSDADHERLLVALKDCKSNVMLSGYANDIYDRHLDGWHRYDIEQTYVTGEGQSKTRQTQSRTECIWVKRPIQATLF